MRVRNFLAGAVAAILLATLPAAGLAAESGMAMQMGPQALKVGTLEISGPFARATLPGASAAGGYLTITNKGATPDRLESARSPAAGSVSLHSMSMEGNVMKMTALPHGIDVPAGATVKLTPSGLHMMFEHLKGPFVEGKTVPVTLTFAKAGTITVNLDVLGIAANAPMQGMSM